MDSNISMRFEEVKRRIAAALRRRPSALNSRDVRLVAVSKLQSIESIISLYKSGQRVFGENYIKELLTKSCDQKILSECPEIEWRFIGHLQTNKVNQLLRVNRLSTIESIDSLKLAETLEKSLKERSLDVMIQINSSQEENKNGIEAKDALEFVEKLRTNCPKLAVLGLMTIGRFDHDWGEGPNPDFQTLVACAHQLREKTGIPLELSFGMSDDFEHAIEMGSTEVRIGTSLFGPRNKQ